MFLMIASACLPSYVIIKTVCSKNQEKRCDDFGTHAVRTDRVENLLSCAFALKR